MLKGVLSLLLLRLCEAREDYGYSIVVRLHRSGFADLAEGTVYPALSRLESRGLLEAYLVPSSSGPARKYYRLTDSGRTEMVRAHEAWIGLVSAVDGALNEGLPGDEPGPKPVRRSSR